MPMDTSAAALAAMLTAGGPEGREAAYATIEAAVRGSGARGEERERAVALAVACARPLIVSVLHAPAAKVAEEEWLRAALLLSEMTKMDMVAVVAETLRKDDAGLMPFFSIWTTPGTVYAAVLAKDPGAVRAAPGAVKHP